MVFKKGNQTGRPKLQDFNDLTPETHLYISQLITKTLGYQKIKEQLALKGIKISVAELRKHIKTINPKSEKRYRNRVKRVLKNQIDAWIDGSNLAHSDNFTRPKKSKALYIKEVDGLKMFKLYAYTDRFGRKDLIIIKTTSSGEKSIHFKELLIKVSLKGWLKNITNLSIDQQVSINPSKKKGREMKEFLDLNNITLVRQEKSTAHPYQSEVEGIFGTIKSKFIKWLNQYEYNERKDEKRIYNITETMILEQIKTLTEVYLYRTDITPNFDLVENNKIKVAVEVRN